MMRCFSFTLAWLFSLTALAAEPPAAPATQPVNPYLQNVPAQSWIGVTQTPYGPMMMQQGLPPPYRDYQMNRILTPEEKKRWLQMAMPMMANMMQMDAREAMNYFAVKYKAKPGLTFDEVVESMMLRANKVNLKFVGSNLMWKDFKAVLNDEGAPRVEVFSFCDIAVGRDLLRDHSRNGGVPALPHHGDGRRRQEHLGDDAGLGRNLARHGRQTDGHHARIAQGRTGHPRQNGQRDARGRQRRTLVFRSPLRTIVAFRGGLVRYALAA